jgi:ribosome maturation factor RimP
MSKPTEIKDKLLELSAPVCAGSGYELVDLAFTREQDGWVLRVFIDNAAAEEGGISFADCEHVSRELSTVLDVEDPITQAYRLEVSSPGLDRPLRTAEHFRRQIGEVVKARLHIGVDGRRNFRGTIQSVEPAEREPTASEADDDRAAVITLDVDGQPWKLPVADLESARLVPDWDRLFTRSRKQG